MITKKFGGIPTHKRILVYLIFSLLLCYLFTYHYSNEVKLDIRLVPFIIGSLYFRLSPILVFVIILLRIPYGIDDAFYSETIVYSLLGLLFWFVQPWFEKLEPTKRVLLATFTTFLINFAILQFIMRLTSPISKIDLHLDLGFAFILLPTLSVAMISYIIEVLEKNAAWQKELVKLVELETIELMSTAISHDIRNPLTTAIGYVELLGNHSISTDKRNDYLIILKEELASAERVTKDFLTFSKPSLDFQEELDVQKELGLIITLLEPLTNFHSIKIISELHSSTKIKGNKSNFHQCIINTLKYMIESSSKNNLLEIKTTETKKKAIILIKDATRVITKKQVQIMEESYFSTMSNVPNRSLNIMVARSIIQSMSGKILINSTPKLGTVIQISFPIPTKGKENRQL